MESVKHHIADDIETLVQFVERWNKQDKDKGAAEAAARTEAWLATMKNYKDFE